MPTFGARRLIGKLDLPLSQHTAGICDPMEETLRRVIREEIRRAD